MKRLFRDDIYELVWSMPMTEVAKKYLISDVGFRKLCIRLGVPFPKLGDWAKVKAGHKIKKLPLPTGWKGKAYADLEERAPEQPVKQVSELDKLIKQITKERLPFKVPDRISLPDPLTVAAKESLAMLTDPQYPGMRVTAKKQLDIRVTQSNIGRALRFMNAFVKLVRARGHKFEANEEGNFVLIREVRLRVKFREITRRIRVQHSGYQDYAWQPTGQVVFRLDGRLKAQWMDLKTQLLEEQLPKVLAKLELTARLEEDYLEKARLWHQNWERQRKLDLEREARKKQEVNEVRGLIDQAQQWKRAQLLRDYLAAMPDANPEWLTWAKKKADWFDPLISAEDELLIGTSKNDLWK